MEAERRVFIFKGINDSSSICNNALSLKVLNGIFDTDTYSFITGVSMGDLGLSIKERHFRRLLKELKTIKI